MTKEQLRAAIDTAASVELTTAELRELFASGPDVREWAAKHGIALEPFKGGVVFRAK